MARTASPSALAIPFTSWMERPLYVTRSSVLIHPLVLALRHRLYLTAPEVRLV